MVKFQGKENSVTLENKEIYGEGNCISIAPTAKELASACYPGHFYVSASKGLINAVNVVDVEEYLRGVVPYEIGKLDSSRFSALESQAIAARTYAYKHFGSRESLGFDVYADTKDQVYKGLASATPLTDSAVKATAGIVMTYDGQFIIAYYHSPAGAKPRHSPPGASPICPTSRASQTCGPMEHPGAANRATANGSASLPKRNSPHCSRRTARKRMRRYPISRT